MIEEVRITRPWPLCSSAGMQALTESIVPLTLVAKIASMSASLMASSLTSGNTPAFAHRTSMPPRRSLASAAMRSQSAATATSAWM